MMIANVIAGVTLALVVAVLVRAMRTKSAPTPSRWTRTAAWGALPLVGAVGLFVVGLRGYVDAAVAPADAVPIFARFTGWQWRYEYPGGFQSDSLRVPRGRPVQLTLRSTDLPLRFASAEHHVDVALEPFVETTVWFTPRRSGPILCGDVCAGGHEAAAGKLEVIDGAEFDGWIDEGGGKLTPVALGARLYVRSTCQTCHSTDGKPGTGPSFKGLFGKHETLADGREVKVDEAYIRESIFDPTAKVVRGFQPVMPPFKGQLDDKQVEALIAFIKDVKP